MSACYAHPLCHQASCSMRVRPAPLRMGKRRLQQQQQLECLRRHERVPQAWSRRTFGGKRQDRRPRRRQEQLPSLASSETSDTCAVPVAGFREGRGRRRRHSQVAEPQRGGVSAGACGIRWVRFGSVGFGWIGLWRVMASYGELWPTVTI